ncbi:MAG: alpha-L-fucosidase [Bryobacteraceae bacterium]
MNLRLLAALLLAPALHAAGDDRMKWWRDARFGMFIHWGLYSTLGGEWEGFDYGKEMGGASAEWIMLQARIPKERYAALAGRFNPVKFSAKEWVSLAREAGMRYMVITSKHHDGFSMFRTQLTPYNIVDATPFRRDPIAELAAECRRQGLKFGLYYSHSKDWYHRKTVNRDPDPPSPDYVKFVKGQLRELLTGYGDLGIIWFDTGDQFADVNTEYGRLVRELQPNALISGRLNGREGASDYKQEGDRRIPPRRVAGDVETPMTLRDNWGYDRDESNWKSERDILERLSLTACRGANMLLNVGPKPDGTLCPEEIERLKAIGRWMSVNGEAIYGTSASPFDFDFAWGSMTQKANRLYLHVLRSDAQGISFNGLRTRIVKAALLADRSRKVDVEQMGGAVRIRVPSPPRGIFVVALDLAGPIETDPAATGAYHWVKDVDIRLNREKMKRQRAQGWKATR